ncbi:hypothetical protein [Anatilimnocola aggregata]|nr:hypothetical protein [Anatilimnocola aggregata]
MSAPFRVNNPGAQLAALAEPNPDEQFRLYLERLMKMMPGDAVGMYLVGSGFIPTDEKVWIVIWAIIGLIAVIVLRIYGTRNPAEGQGVQWATVVISSIAFVIWVYTLGGPFVVFGIHKPFIGSLMVLAWTFFVPIFYKGD